MSRVLKTSGFVGLTVQMLWGMQNVVFHMVGTPDYYGQFVGAHAHFGVLGILAVVTGFAVDEFEVSGNSRTLAVWGFVIGQWLLPLTLVLQGVLAMPQLGITIFLWGILLFASMAVMARAAWSSA